MRIREKAKEIAIDLKIEHFKGTNKWIFNFCRRHNLASRRITNVGQADNKSPLIKRQIAIDYLSDVEVLTTNLNNDMIYNMDETPVYIDMLSSSTISFIGEKNTEADATGHTKMRFTVALCISASGKIIKSLVILKDLKNVPKCKVPTNLVLTVAKKGSMNTLLMKEWINKCFNAQGPFFAQSKKLLLTHKLVLKT